MTSKSLFLISTVTDRYVCVELFDKSDYIINVDELTGRTNKLHNTYTMSESHGTALILKRHEDLEKVAAYVKQTVREKSLDLLGEDLSEDDKFVGLRINEEENEIIWHDYGHHGTHLDFNPISESVIKEFPDVEMERQGWWGQEVWNYLVADGKWQKYTLWKFYAYTGGKSDELQLEHKEPEYGRTEEEKCEERERMCKEIAERLSLLQPEAEIAVYAYDYYELYPSTEWFCRAKGGNTTIEHVDHGLVRIMDYFDEIEWVESLGHVLLHPMEFAAEVIRRAREGEDYCPAIAAEMMMNGFTSNYFSLIEPTDKEWLMKLAEEQENIGAIYCLLYGMRKKFQYFYETFVDDDLHEEVSLLRSDIVEGSTFEKNEGEEERLIQKVMEQKHRLSVEELTKLCFEIDDKQELLLELIRKGDEEAAIFIDDPVILQELCDKGNKTAAEQMAYIYAYGDEANGIFVDYVKAAEYMKLAGKEFNANDYQEEADPHDFDYSLKGDAGTLGAIRTMIDNLCQRFGTPGNELGMFVPLGPVMQKLVGSPHYEGNILSMEQPNPDCLILKTEANSGAPLLYALRQAFANLDVEVKETKW